MFVIPSKFVISIKSGQCDCSPWASKHSYATALLNMFTLSYPRAKLDIVQLA